KALLHIEYGKVLLLLYQFSMGTVAEHHIAGFHVLVVQQVAFHSPAIDLEKMVGAQVVSGKADLDVLEPEQGPEDVLEAFYEVHTPLGVPPDQGRLISEMECSEVTSNILEMIKPLAIKLLGGIFSFHKAILSKFAKSSSTSSGVSSRAFSVGRISMKSALYRMR